MATMEDIMNLPEGERAELIDGVLSFMPTPKTNHQSVAVYLGHILYSYVEERKGDCQVFMAPFSVFLFDDDKTYVEPDLCVVCDKSKLREDGCHGAPDLIAEILSPSSIVKDTNIKLNKYKFAGVREYWVVDIDNRVVWVHTFERSISKCYRLDEQAESLIFDGFHIALAKGLVWFGDAEGSAEG